MKKKFLTALVMTALSFSVTAQTDGFFSSNYKEYNPNRWEPTEDNIPIFTEQFGGTAFHEDLFNEVIVEEAPTLDNIGNYHISKVDNVNLNYNGGNSYTFSNICFKSHTSIACFDLSEYKEDAIKISYQNINNCYTLAYVPWFDNQINEEGTNGEITILYPSADTYVALLPQIYKDPESYGQESAYSMAPIENTIITFTNAITNEVIGTVTFPKGVQNGRLYTGPNFKPIKIGKRSTVVETEL